MSPDGGEDSKEAGAWERRTTELNASVLSVCDTGTLLESDDVSEWTDVVAVGLYQLEQKPAAAAAEVGCDQGGSQVRTGGIQLFRFARGSDGGDGGDRDAKSLSPCLRDGVIDTGSGVFELKWFQQLGHGAHTLALAKAGGEVSIHRIGLPDTRDGAGESRRVEAGEDKELSSQSLTEGREGVFCLCVDVEDRGPGSQSERGRGVAASTSDGFLHLLRCREAELSLVSQWRAHDLEPWSVSLDKSAPHLLYSGADDSLLLGWDLRAPTDRASLEVPASPPEGDWEPSRVFLNRRAHEAGVCCVRTHASRPEHLVSGSYDERVRVWDKRNLGRPLVVHEVEAGGGVWRLEWCAWDPAMAVAACMYGGCKALGLRLDAGAVDVVAQYKGHGSIAYGADFLPPLAEVGASDGVDVVSCSFYDNQVHGWTF